jgi:hypothetical protein
VWALALLPVAVSGCASIGTSVRVERFEATVRAYDRALRWSDYPTAFALASRPGTPPPNLKRLQGIRVTSYDRIGAPQAAARGTEIVQGVEIRYVHLADMAERVLQDRQVWEYVEQDNRWYLRSEFPAFP